MVDSKLEQRSSWSNLWLIVTGAGIGWLMGLSISPVLSIVITSVVGAAAAVVVAMSGLERDGETDSKDENDANVLPWRVSPVPLAMLVIGLFGGSLLAIWVRTHNLLSPLAATEVALATEVDQWVELGLDQEQVVQGLFDSRVSSVQWPEPGLVDPQHGTVLFGAGVTQSECDQWIDLIEQGDYAELKGEIQTANADPVRKLPDIVADEETLAEIVGGVICADVTQP